MAKRERRQFPPFNIINLLFIQGPALLDSIPFLNAFPAAGGGCMLGNEYRMVSIISIDGPWICNLSRNISLDLAKNPCVCNIPIISVSAEFIVFVIPLIDNQKPWKYPPSLPKFYFFWSFWAWQIPVSCIHIRSGLLSAWCRLNMRMLNNWPILWLHFFHHREKSALIRQRIPWSSKISHRW